MFKNDESYNEIKLRSLQDILNQSSIRFSNLRAFNDFPAAFYSVPVTS